MFCSLHRLPRPVALRTATLAAAALAMPAVPAYALTASGYTSPGDGVLVGTMTSTVPWAGPCTAVTLHESATATIAIDYPGATYAGPATLTLDVPDASCPAFVAASTLSISGQDSLGATFACSNLPAAYVGLPGLSDLSTGAVIQVSSEGHCAVNGADTGLIDITEFGTLAPTSVTTAAVSGALTLWWTGR